MRHVSSILSLLMNAWHLMTKNRDRLPTDLTVHHNCSPPVTTGWIPRSLTALLLSAPDRSRTLSSRPTYCALHWSSLQSLIMRLKMMMIVIMMMNGIVTRHKLYKQNNKKNDLRERQWFKLWPPIAKPKDAMWTKILACLGADLVSRNRCLQLVFA